jgi:uridine monophosphate synthetase
MIASPTVDELAPRLYRLGAVQFGSFTLKSGAVSPVYLDLRLVASEPALLRAIARAYAAIMAPLDFDRIAGIPLAALPLATAISLEMDRPLIYPRLDAKAHGTGRRVEGVFAAGETAVVVDDVISSGASKIEAIVPLQDAGLVVRDVVVLVDREGTGRTDLEAAGYRLHAVATLSELVAALAAAGHVPAETVAAVREFVAASQAAR